MKTNSKRHNSPSPPLNLRGGRGELLVLIFFLFFLAPLDSRAGGPLTVNSDGVASVWETSDSNPIAIHPESGACGTFSNTDTVDKLEENISVWPDIAGVNLSFAIEEGELGSVDADNYDDFIVLTAGSPGLNDGLNPILFDNDGEITVDLFGECNQYTTLGAAGPDAFTGGNFATIAGGEGVFNCFCVGGCTVTPACGSGEIGFTEDDLDFTMTHEIGHMLNLDHSQVNIDLAEAGCSLDDAGDCDDLPTMFPVSEDPVDQISPTWDDEVALLTLYGGSTLNSFCTVTGSLIDTGGDPLRCADVQAETADTADAIAQVSGAFAAAEDSDGDGYKDGEGECLSNCGDFALRGLDPGKTYTITVKPIVGIDDIAFIGGSSVGPCGSGQLTGIEEEVIASGVNCGAGETEALGTIATASTGGITEGGDGDGDDDGSVSLGCSLALSPESGSPLVPMIALVFAVLVLKRVLLRQS